jgi:hypothetical protein
MGHRFVENGGLLGEALRHRHWVHHEREYPAGNLRPNKHYQDAKDWSWYALAFLTFCMLGLLGWFHILKLPSMLALSMGGVVYLDKMQLRYRLLLDGPAVRHPEHPTVRGNVFPGLLVKR